MFAQVLSKEGTWMGAVQVRVDGSSVCLLSFTGPSFLKKDRGIYMDLEVLGS